MIHKHISASEVLLPFFVTFKYQYWPEISSISQALHQTEISQQKQINPAAAITSSMVHLPSVKSTSLNYKIKLDCNWSALFVIWTNCIWNKMCMIPNSKVTGPLMPTETSFWSWKRPDNRLTSPKYHLSKYHGRVIRDDVCNTK